MSLRKRLGVKTAIVSGAVISLVVSCATMSRLMVTAPEIPGAEFVGNEQCSLCHEDVVKRFPGSAHARIHAEDVDGQGLSGCESCHGPGSLHVAAGDGKHIINPQDSAESCYRCHADKKAEFALPNHHPVPEGKMACADCHDPHGADAKKPRGGLFARTNDTCAQCHAEQTAPKVYEHEALREGCTSCHAVHGSINRKMLVQNDITLCMKCHTQVQSSHTDIDIGSRPHSGFIGRPSTCWGAGCHNGVHGSNFNQHLRY